MTQLSRIVETQAKILNYKKNQANIMNHI
jgi:hypothetical protein